jgi:hypothetical protein
MPARIGDRPLSNAERQKRQRQRLRERLEATEEAVRFVMTLRPGSVHAMDAQPLKALQRRLEALR